MSELVSVALGWARTLLNDDDATNWTDPVLIPKLQVAHKELQFALRNAGVPLMRAMSSPISVLTGALTVTLPTDLVEPITLWEAAAATPLSGFVLMTEKDPLPLVAQAATLKYWQWYQETITFVGATAGRYVMMKYKRSLTLPDAAGDSIGFINGENYLAPRTAALAALSNGNKDLHDVLTQTATATLSTIILANRGRVPPSQGSAPRP